MDFIQGELGRKYLVCPNLTNQRLWFVRARMTLKPWMPLAAPTPSSGCSHVCNKLEKINSHTLKRAKFERNSYLCCFVKADCYFRGTLSCYTNQLN